MRNQSHSDVFPVHDKAQEPSPARENPIDIAAFDFDGTLTCADSFVTFLRDLAPQGSLYPVLLSHPDWLWAYALTRDRGRLKARLLHALIGSVTRIELVERAQSFATMVDGRFLRPDAVAKWREHESRGHTCVIVTASPELTVAPLTHILGAPRVIGTRLKFDSDGRLLPETDGPNCRRGEKVRRLFEAFPGARLVAAYGDTSGDTELLAAAQSAGYRVFRAQAVVRPGRRVSRIDSST